MYYFRRNPTSCCDLVYRQKRTRAFVRYSLQEFSLGSAAKTPKTFSFLKWLNALVIQVLSLLERSSVLVTQVKKHGKCHLFSVYENVPIRIFGVTHLFRRKRPWSVGSWDVLNNERQGLRFSTGRVRIVRFVPGEWAYRMRQKNINHNYVQHSYYSFRSLASKSLTRVTKSYLSF